MGKTIEEALAAGGMRVDEERGAPSLDLFDAEVPPREGGPRTWLIGEQNPYGDDPAFALYPRPENSAGGRLCRMLGLGGREYLARFERRNLLGAGPWSAPRAREAADALLRGHPRSDRIVLLGARVAAAFGCAFRRDLFEPRFVQVGTAVLRGRRVLVAPHPSGLSREWNDPAAPARLREALGRLEGAADL